MDSIASIVEFPAVQPAGVGLSSLDSYDGQFFTGSPRACGREVSSLERPHTNTTMTSYPDGEIEVTGNHVFPSSARSRPPSTEEEKRKRAASRARGAILQKAHFFGLCYLWTLTYRGPQFNRLKVIKQWRRFYRLVQVHFPEFVALMVLELHKGGGANDGGYHIHFATNDFYAVQVLRACWYEVLGFGPDGCTLGQVDIAPGKAGRRGWHEVGHYIFKYIGKDLDSDHHEKNSHYYYQCGKLKIPLVKKAGEPGREKSRTYRGSPFSREKEVYYKILFLTGKVPKVWCSADGFQFRYSTF